MRRLSADTRAKVLALSCERRTESGSIRSSAMHAARSGIDPVDSDRALGDGVRSVRSAPVRAVRSKPSRGEERTGTVSPRTCGGAMQQNFTYAQCVEAPFRQRRPYA